MHAIVQAADIQDRDCGAALVATLLGAFPFLTKLFADGGYRGQQFQGAVGRSLAAAMVEIVKRSDMAKAFVLLPRRWIVERTLAWLGRCRRLAKDWECLNRRALTFLCLASLRLMLRTLCNPTQCFRTDCKTAILLFFCLSISGCATSALDMAPRRPDQPWTPATTPEGEIVAGEQGISDKGSGYVLPANRALATGLPVPTINPAKVYSLSDLVDLAESTNPTTRIAWDDAKRAALAAGIVESAYLPQITASALTGWQSGGVKSGVTGVGSSSSSSLTGTVGALSMNWLLFDFGERAATIDAAKQLSVVSNIAFTEAHQQVILAVALTFYANSAAEARLATASQSLKNAETVQAAAEDRYNHGVGTVTEAAQARQGTAQAKLALVEATGRAQDAYVALLTAVGVSPTLKIKVADVSGRKLSPASVKPVENIIADALSRRPDIQGAYAAEKASVSKVYAAEAEFMPKVFVNAAGTYNEGNLNVSAIPSAGQNVPATLNVSGPRWGGSVFAGVAVPVYDGGSRAALLAQARSDADAAAARLERIRQDAVRQIVLADNALHTALQSYSASEALIAAAQKTFDSALDSYRSGEASVTDLNLAQTQLLQAKNASADSHAAALSAAATLAFATGALGGAPK